MGDEHGDSDDTEESAPRKPSKRESEPLRLDLRRSRVTVDFTGPPLDLPEERSDSYPSLDGVDVAGGEEGLSLEGSPSATDALDLVDRSRPSEPELDLAAEMKERFALDDFTGALRIAELLLGREPDHIDAKHVADESRRRLEQLYTSRLGGLQGIPRIGVPETDIRWLGLDNRAAFLLSRVDGAHTLEELVDVSGMPRIEALKTLVGLQELGAIKIGS